MSIILTVSLVLVALVAGVVVTHVINKTVLANRAKTIIEEVPKRNCLR